MLNDSTTEEENRDFVSDSMMHFIHTINYAILCGALSLFGIATNIINMIVFVGQGFQETINISLLALSVSDLCSSIGLLFVSICYNPFFMYSGLPILTTELQFYVGAWTHVMFVRITGLITAFITLERCLCIAFPLRIKTLVSPFRAKVIIVGIFVLAVSTMSPNYFGTYLGYGFVPRLNRTMIINIPTTYEPKIRVFMINIQPFYPIISFSGVAVCSYILIYKLRQRGKWRSTSATISQGMEKSMARDQQIVKMVIYVAIIFIISYTPSLILFVIMAFNSEFILGKKYQNSFILLLSISFVFEGINSAANIFVYYKTNSNHRQRLKSLFLKKST